LSQRALAERAGLSVAAVRDLEQGRTSRPQLRSVHALIAALELDSDAAAAWWAAADTDRPAQARTETEAMTGELWIGVLGPLIVRRGDAEAGLGRGRRRAVLGRLAVDAGNPVPMTELVDLLWSGRPPPTAVGAIQTCVCRLRTVVDPAGRGGPYRILSSPANGYQLRLREDQLDLLAFRALCRQAALVDEPAAELELLTAALGLWRGEPLVDVPQLRGHPVTTALVDEHVAIALRHADLAEKVGRPQLCLPRLRHLAAEHPLHEPLHARLIRVLSAAGQQADALVVFDGIRRRLAEELGIDAGSELAAEHRRVLCRDTGAGADPARAVTIGHVPTPAQLPADTHHFTGRRREQNRMDELLEASRRTRAVVITSITGTAGVGKTALAVHWAHRVRNRFPDGQLYVNLRGFDASTTAMNPMDAIRRFLDALGAHAERVPPELDAQAALYRSLLADKRVLIVLDNARDTDQVRYLLPGTATCLVIITSRDPLIGLVTAEGADALPLDLLSPAEARELLADRVGRQRTTAEPDAVADIVGHCARLPLALAIVGARAATKPSLRLASLAAELRDHRHRLDALSTGTSTIDARAVFSWSYRALTPAVGTLFRLLGLHPGPDLTETAAASLGGVSPPQVRRLLSQLVGANLIVEHSPGRYTMHDLLQAYASELVEVHHTDGQRRIARLRMLDHYLHTAHSAAVLLNPHRQPIRPAPPHPQVTIERIDSPHRALSWFSIEQPVLRAAVDQAAAAGFDTHCWQLAWTLWNFFDRRGLWHHLLATQRTALAAAQRLDDRTGQATAHRALARAYAGLGQLDDADNHYRRALARSIETADRAGQATAHLGLARVLDHRGEPERALCEAQAALKLYPPGSSDLERAWALNAVGWHHAQLGDYALALAACQEALTQLENAGDRFTQAATWDSIAYAHRRLGDRPQALACYLQAFNLYRDIGARYQMAETLIQVGDSHEAFGDHDAAQHAYRQALDILTDLGNPGADHVRKKLVR